MATLKRDNFQATRITVQSSNAFDRILQKLYFSIGNPSRIDEWKKTAKSITSYSAESRKAFEDKINATVGEHGFMTFQEFDHGAWIPLFGFGDGLKNAGLAVPVEILLREVVKGEACEIIYNLPSELITGLNKDKKLVEAVKILDEKLEILVRWACE